MNLDWAYKPNSICPWDYQTCGQMIDCVSCDRYRNPQRVESEAGE